MKFLWQRLHISWSITAWCFGLLIGVLLAGHISNNLYYSNLLLIISLIVSIILIIRCRLFMIPVLIITGGLFGFWRGTFFNKDLGGYSDLYDQSVSVVGRVKDDIDIKNDSQMSIRLEVKSINDESVGGTVYVTARKGDIKRGDELWLSGKLQPGFGSFSGVIYRAEIKKIIQPTPGDVARRLRDWFSDKIHQLLPETEASLGVGFLLGQRRSLSPELQSAFRTTGLIHIVVASGYHLTVLVRLCRRLFIRISKYTALLASVLTVFGFMSVTGLTPSMTRASIVALLSLLAWYYGRKFNPIILLIFVMAVTVLINPYYIWGDMGWQLSFAAFAGVMILAPLINNYFFGDKKPNLVRQILVESLSAQLLTAPIIIMAFGQMSSVAALVNILILPFVPMAMILTFLTGLSGWLLSGLGFIANLVVWPARLILGYMLTIINYFAGFSWASIQIEPNLFIPIISYTLLLGLGIYLYFKTKFNLRDSNLIE